jgi:hypothetical protein
MLAEALEGSGITPGDVVRHEPVGDGALYVFPDRLLGSVVDLAERLDKLAERHNRWQQPLLRLRVAVHVGAVGDEPGLYAPMTHLNRLLDADSFKALVNRCVEANGDGQGTSTVNSGMIMSAAAFRTVFGGDYTSLVHDSDFAELDVANKEFAERAWVRVPGVSRATLAGLIDDERLPDVAEQEVSVDHTIHVNNYVRGRMENSVQAGVVHGGVYFGRESK